jgi:hypothetical protein
MNSLRKFIATLSLILITCYSFSQFHTTGSAPYSVKWKSIKTDHFRLIYPAETESMAQKYASSLSYLYPFTSHSLNHQPTPIDVIMYNQSILSNAYVVWAPKRMELVTTTPQKQYAHDWLEQLALHEYRHVVQIDKLNQSFTKGLSVFTGQVGVGAMLGFVPRWFLEGDAVANETALTNTGRGRDPNFIQDVMAAEMQRTKRFKYDEFYLGTYKDYAPSHYHYGYQMVAWSNMQFGEQVWSKVLDNVARKPFTIAPFYFKLNKETHLSKTSLYEQTSDYLHTNWEKENADRKSVASETEKINTQYKSNFVSYQFPYQQADGSILALRTSIDDIARIVRINDGREEIIYTIGYFQGSKVCYTEKYIAWEEVQYDMRWEQKSFSVIRILNMETGKTEVLKSKERHFSPSILAGSNKICLINDDGIYNTYIEIYDIESKLLIERFKATDNAKFSFPTWLDKEQIAVVALTDKGKSIRQLNTSTSEWKELLAPGFENITNLYGKLSNLYFSYTLNGRVNIYQLSAENLEVYKVSEEPVGSNFASISNLDNSLVYSEYTSQGYKPRKLKLYPEIWTAISDIKPYTYTLAEASAQHGLVNIQDSLVPQQHFESKPYRKAALLINIHSWLAPFYVNLDALPDENTKLYPGFTLLSQNSLSTVTSSISYYYSDGYHHIRPSISVRMFYPVLTFDYHYGGPAGLYTSNAQINSVSEHINKKTEFNTELSLPLKFSTSRYSLIATPSLKHHFDNRFVADSVNRGNIEFQENGIFYTKGYAGLDYRFSFYLATKLAYKALRPKWGIYYYVSHQKPFLQPQYWAPYENTIHIITAYVPGVFRLHSLKGQIGFENGFGKRLALPRGYSFVTDYKSAQKFSADYAFPVLYPNLSLGPIAYIKRIQANLFYDYFDYYTYNSQLVYFHKTNSSTGLELGIETNFLRFFWTFVPTIRYSYLIESGGYNWGFFFSNSFGFSLGRKNSIAN